MLTFNLKTTFFTVKTSNEVYCCRIYFVNYIQNVHIINRTLHGSLEDMDFMFSWQEQYLTRSLRSLVRYRSCHSNIKSISSRNRVISYINAMLVDPLSDPNWSLSMQCWVDCNKLVVVNYCSFNCVSSNLLIRF